MTIYEIYATERTSQTDKGKYKYVTKTTVIPQLNSILNNLTALGHDVKVLTTYPDRTQCVSVRYAKEVR